MSSFSKANGVREPRCRFSCLWSLSRSSPTTASIQARTTESQVGVSYYWGLYPSTKGSSVFLKFVSNKKRCDRAPRAQPCLHTPTPFPLRRTCFKQATIICSRCLRKRKRMCLRELMHSTTCRDRILPQVSAL